MKSQEVREATKERIVREIREVPEGMMANYANTFLKKDFRVRIALILMNKERREISNAIKGKNRDYVDI